LWTKVVDLKMESQTSMAYPCNASYMGGWDLKDHTSRSLWQIICEITISKIIKAKWTRVVAQAVNDWLCKHEALSSNPSPSKQSNKGRRRYIWDSKRKKDIANRKYMWCYGGKRSANLCGGELKGILLEVIAWPWYSVGHVPNGRPHYGRCVW
jgi:hypothetical protein